LAYQLGDTVFDALRPAVVGEAGGKLSQNARLLLDLAQQQRAGFGRHRAPIKTGHHFSLKMTGKGEANLVTLCH